jgi:hypothetical protein
VRHPQLTFSRYEKIFVGSKERIFIYMEEEKGCTQIWNGGREYDWKYYGERRARERCSAGKGYIGRR